MHKRTIEYSTYPTNRINAILSQDFDPLIFHRYVHALNAKANALFALFAAPPPRPIWFLCILSSQRRRVAGNRWITRIEKPPGGFHESLDNLSIKPCAEYESRFQRDSLRCYSRLKFASHLSDFVCPTTPTT